MLWAYFDDSEYYPDEDHPSLAVPSGEYRQRAIALGGCVASCEAWCKVLPAWSKVLEEAGVSWFHAKELAHFEGEFKKWRDKPDREAIQRAFWNSLIQILNDHQIVRVGCLMPAHQVMRMREEAETIKRQLAHTEDWWQLETERFMRTPAAYCFACCMQRVAHIGRRAAEKIGLVFARTRGLEHAAERVFRFAARLQVPFTDLISQRIFDGRPQQLIQLQAADLVAYELTRYQRPETVRWQFAMLTQRHFFWHVEDPPMLTRGWLEETT